MYLALQMSESAMPSRDTEQFCEISYLYRDAANFKCWGSFVVKGNICLSDLTEHMIDKEYFIPEMAGIPKLNPDEWSDDDHDFHEIQSVKSCDRAPYAFTAAELVRIFCEQSRLGWIR